MPTLPLFEPPGVPLAGMRTSPHPLLLAPGEQALVSNLRWGELGSPVVRNGVVQYLGAPAGAVSVVDTWAGTLNGVPTYAMVAAFSDGMRIFASQNGGALAEITGTGTFFGPSSGSTRFLTVTSAANFTAVRTPGGLDSGGTVVPRDVLVVQNGVDSPRIWDPGNSNAAFALTVHDPLSLPSGYLGFRYSAGLSNYLQLAGAGGKHYYSGTLINQPEFGIVDAGNVNTVVGATAASPIVLTLGTGQAYLTGDVYYVSGMVGISGGSGFFTVKWIDATHIALEGSTGTGTWASGGAVSPTQYATSVVPIFTVAPSVGATEVATVRFDAPVVVKRQLLMVVESPNAVGVLSGCKIEVSEDPAAYNFATHWHTVFDPTTTGTLSSFASYPFDANANRSILAFRTDALTVPQTVYQIRFTWMDVTPAPFQSEFVALLMVASAGGYPGGTEWVIAFEDQYSRSEGFGLEASQVDGARLNAVGGPAGVTSPLPTIQAIWYDYTLVIPNLDEAFAAAVFRAGGLNREPSAVAVYMRLPGQTNALYGFGLVLQDPGTSLGVKGWLPANSGQTFSIATDRLNYFNVNLADPTRPSPSAYQISIPPANCSCWASSRLFVGDVANPDGTRRGADVYFSSASQTFRMASIPVDGQGAYDPSGGSRATFAGETVKALVASASMAEGASYVYAMTDSALHMLGGGGIMGGLTDSQSLGTPHRIGSLGTNSPRTVRERNGVVVWVDQEGTVRRMYGGVPADISRRHVDDRIRGIPAAHREDASAIWTRDRYYLSYAPSGEATNRRMLVWFEPGQVWESEDVPPVAYQRLATLYDPAIDGSGRKLIGMGSDMVSYWHESSSLQDLGSPIPFAVTSRAFNAGSGKATAFDQLVWMGDPVAATSATVDRYYGPFGSLYRSTVPLHTGYGTDSAQRTTEVSAPPDGAGERGAWGQLSVYGSLPGGTRILSLVAAATAVTSIEPAGE